MTTATIQQAPPYQTAREAADYLRISVSALARLPIPKAKLNGRVLYRTETLDEFVRSHEAK